MAIELRIYMVDLLAFVPKGTDVWVLLRDAHNGGTSSVGERLDPHYPIVLFEIPGQAGSDWQNIYSLLKLTGTTRNPHAWLLDGEDIKIPIQTAEPAGVHANPAAPGLYPIKGANATNFGWVPTMESFDSVHAQIDRTCIDSTPPPSKVVARMQLMQGRLETYEFCKFIEKPLLPPKIHAFEFRRLAKPTQILRGGQALSEVVVVKIRLDGTTVQLTTSKGRSITLPSLDGQTINLALANLSPVDTIDKDGKGRHFEYYYALSNANGQPGGVPFITKDTPVDPHVVEDDLPGFMDEVEPGFISLNNRSICSFISFTY